MLGITNERYLMLNYTNISEVEDLDNISKRYNLDASISRDDALKDFHKIAQELVNEDKDLANDIYAPTPDARRLKDKIFKKRYASIGKSSRRS